MTDDSWVLLGQYEFGYQVDLAEATLSEVGIPVLVKGREAGIWGPGFAGAPSQGLTVWVPGERLDEAREAVSPGDALPG